jgi:hypothetical protein
MSEVRADEGAEAPACRTRLRSHRSWALSEGEVSMPEWQMLYTVYSIQQLDKETISSQ